MATERRASERSRSSFLRSSKSAASRAGNSAGPVLSANAAWCSSVSSEATKFSAAAPVSASMRRTPEATALSDDDLEEADIAGAAHMRAAAQLDRVMAVAGLRVAFVAHAHDAHLVAVFLAEEGERPLLHRAVGRHQPGRDLGILADAGVDRRARPPPDPQAPTRADGRSRNAAGRARPASLSASHADRGGGATPDAADGSPSDWRAARRAGAASIRSSTTSPSLSTPCVTLPRWANNSPARFWVSETWNSPPLAENIAPVSPIWPPDSA